ncbi:hypothetical protein KR044_005712, partial [Drosophila immigrans]
SPLQRCPLDDQACLIAQVQSYFQHFAKGIPELQVPSLEPMQLGEVRALSTDANGPFSLKLRLDNTSLHKFSQSQVSSIKGFTGDLSKPLKLSWMLSAKKLELHAKYDMSGKIMLLPLSSKGDVVIRLNDVQIKSRVTAEPEKRNDGKYYLKLIEHKSVSKVGSGDFSMSNVSTTSQVSTALQESTFALLKNEWDALSAFIQPRILEAYDRAFKELIGRLWHAVPYDQFFD